MFAFELERALLVRLAREQRRLELHFVMAGVAVCAGGAAFELAVMNVFVAIAAERVRHRSAEIVVLVALRAGRFGMLPVQRKLGLVVIKAAGGKDRSSSPPSNGRSGRSPGTMHPEKRRDADRRGNSGNWQRPDLCNARRFLQAWGRDTARRSRFDASPVSGKAVREMVKALGRLPGVLIVATQALGA